MRVYYFPSTASEKDCYLVEGVVVLEIVVVLLLRIPLSLPFMSPVICGDSYERADSFFAWQAGGVIVMRYHHHNGW